MLSKRRKFAIEKKQSDNCGAKLHDRMANVIHFTKMQGAGNDYIYVDTFLYPIPDPARASISWSRPHNGIGSDGLVLIGAPATDSGADYSMRIFNADGSEALMCGNASRCVGKYLYERGLTDKTEIRLETRSGVKTLRLKTAGARAEAVSVDMLEPQFDVPELFTGQLPHCTGELGEGIFVSMGNPHYVTFVDDIAHMDIATYGPKIENDAAFPQRCNIEFAEITDKDTIRVRVWERGSGITMACGTGACTTAVAAARTGRTGRRCRIDMDGGTLGVDWDERSGHVFLSGPAEFVFDGEISLDEVMMKMR